MSRNNEGLSLLEVILALAILAISMAAIGELLRLGSESAREAQMLTRAQILCESKLSEIVSGALPPDPVVRMPIVTDPDWYYSSQLAATEEPGVMMLTVTVETHIERPNPIAFSLVRWIPDPGIELPEDPAQPTGGGTDSTAGGADTDSPGGQSNNSSGGNGNNNDGGRTNLPGNLPGSLPGNLPGDLPGNLPRNLPDNLPGNLPSNLPDELRDRLR